MPQTYITVAEKYVRSFLPDDRFDVEHRQLYHNRITPTMIATLIREYGADDAINLLEYVVDHIEKRREKAKNRLNRYALTCYASWLKNAVAQIEQQYRPQASQTRRQSVIEAIHRVFA
jgi:hypothetical protein